MSAVPPGDRDADLTGAMRGLQYNAGVVPARGLRGRRQILNVRCHYDIEDSEEQRDFQQFLENLVLS